jgi:hypothetical protein
MSRSDPSRLQDFQEIGLYGRTNCLPRSVSDLILATFFQPIKLLFYPTCNAAQTENCTGQINIEFSERYYVGSFLTSRVFELLYLGKIES